MAKKNRVKALKHKVKLENKAIAKANGTYIPKQPTPPKSSKKWVGSSYDYIREMQDRVRGIEKNYNRYLDDYVAQEKSKRSLESVIKGYGFLEVPRYSEELNAIGLKVSESDLRVIPNMTRLREDVSAWKKDFYNYLDGMPDEFVASSFGTRVLEGFTEEMTNFYIENQEDPLMFRKFMPQIYDYIKETRDKYVNEGSRNMARDIFGEI